MDYYQHSSSMHVYWVCSMNFQYVTRDKLDKLHLSKKLSRKNAQKNLDKLLRKLKKNINRHL